MTNIERKSRHSHLFWWVIVCLGVVLVSCDGGIGDDLAPGRDRTRATEALNLIVISIDTLRADRLGAYGYDRDTSPAFDALADRGILFANTTANSSWTLPSHMTLFTGLLSSSHGVALEKSRLAPSIPLLSEILEREGYRNFAYTSGGWVSGALGFARGFESYVDKVQRFSTALTLGQRRIEDLDPGDRYFLFLHTYDVHCPYDPADEYVERFQRQPEQDHLEVADRCGNTDFNDLDLSEGQVAFLSDQYDAGIREADDDLSEFVAFLDASGALQDTLLVVLSDHGEELYEHGRIGHERTLHMESLRIPLLMLIPGARPEIVEDAVSLVDVMPTLLDLMAVDAPPMQGRSLVPLLDDSTRRRVSPQYAELERHTELRSVVLGRHHLIRDEEGRDRLYDLDLDPREQQDIASSVPDIVERLGRLLEVQKMRQPAAGQETQDVPAELQEQLEALGYLE